MKRFYLPLIIALFLFACKSEPKPDTDSTVVVTEEMHDFTEKVTDNTESIEDILQKFAESEELKEHDIINQNLSELKIVGQEGDCYTVETPDSGLTRVYEICWTDNKITSITDKGIK